MKATYHLAASCHPVKPEELRRDRNGPRRRTLGTVSLADYVYLCRIDLIYLRRWRTASRNRELREASIVIRRCVLDDELHRQR